MTSTAMFTADEVGFASVRGIVISEPPGLLGVLPTATNNVIVPMLKHFDFTNFPNEPNTALCQILNNPNGTSQPCYFLPYQSDTCVTTTLGNGASYFFTSQLTGCTVQVSGPANTPTVSHANAKGTFMASGATGLAGATTAAQIAIQNMLPTAPMGQISTSVSAITMNSAYTPANIAAGKAVIQPAAGFRIKELAPKMATTHGQDRPELGMIVFGMRNGTGWEFYSAVSTSMAGRQKSGKTYFGFINSNVVNKWIQDSVALGPASRFWP